MESSQSGKGPAENQSTTRSKVKLLGYAFGVSALIGIWWWLESADTNGTASVNRLFIFVPCFAVIAFGFFKNWGLVRSFGSGIGVAIASIIVGVAIVG